MIQLFKKYPKPEWSIQINAKLIKDPPLINKNEKHDFAMLFRADRLIPLLDDSRDLDALMTDANERLKGLLALTFRKVKHDDEIWNCVYVDVEEEA